MPTAIIGQPITFQVLFVDEQNLPLTVADALITIFRFDNREGGDGSRVAVATDAIMTAVGITDPGRYVYLLSNTSSLVTGDVLYSKMSGTNPDTSALMLSEQEFNMVSAVSATGSTGLVARFVRGG